MTHRVDKLYAREVHVVFGVLFYDISVMYRFGTNVLVSYSGH